MSQEMGKSRTHRGMYHKFPLGGCAWKIHGHVSCAHEPYGTWGEDKSRDRGHGIIGALKLQSVHISYQDPMSLGIKDQIRSVCPVGRVATQTTVISVTGVWSLHLHRWEPASPR